tara:strand:- start:28 stop:546 length:519 start_codon:yes stop_codon:yes gene_type:complete
MKAHEHNSENALTFTQRYKPLLVILATVIFSAGALALVDGRMHRFMETFMGLFLVNFAMFKLIDLTGFAKGFSMYDLIAKRSHHYALAYPFIELGLGLLYLTAFLPVITNILTVAIMLIGGMGVMKAIITGDKHLKCACLGIALNVPLTTVSIIENFGMAFMAGWMLWLGWR